MWCCVMIDVFCVALFCILLSTLKRTPKCFGGSFNINQIVWKKGISRLNYKCTVLYFIALSTILTVERRKKTYEPGGMQLCVSVWFGVCATNQLKILRCSVHSHKICVRISNFPCSSFLSTSLHYAISASFFMTVIAVVAMPRLQV